MLGFRYIIVNTLHKGDNRGAAAAAADNNNNNNNTCAKISRNKTLT
jgi:hypothetical protein